MTQRSGDYAVLKILKCFILFLLVTVTSKLFNIAQFSVCPVQSRQSVICILMNEFSGIFLIDFKPSSLFVFLLF